MKIKIIILSTFLFSCVAAQSQVLKFGVNLANVSITNDGDIDEAKIKN